MRGVDDDLRELNHLLSSLDDDPACIESNKLSRLADRFADVQS